jgi:Fe-S-cluster-containing dehydrogenase component
LTENKKVYVIEDLCNGCRLCQLVCSQALTKEFNPKKAKIKVIQVDDQGIYMPLVDCDTRCLSDGELPKCVQFCAPGALIYSTLDEAAEMKRSLVNKRAVQPIFRAIAPWKWPFPWKPWPFERGKNNE